MPTTTTPLSLTSSPSPRTPPPIESLLSLSQANLPPPTPNISTHLECGSKLMLVGSSKGHKSWTLMSMAFCVSQPTEKWMGMSVHGCRVLYFNFELDRYYFKERMLAISSALGHSTITNDRLDLWNLRGFSQNPGDLISEFKRRMGSSHPYKLIIVDPFYKFSGSGSVENAAEDMAAVMRVLDEITVDLNVAVAFAHHSAKGDASERAVVDRGSGSGVFGRDPDAIMSILECKGQENAFMADFALRYHPPKPTFGLRWEFPLMRVSEDVDVSRSGGRPRANTDQKLLSLLGSQPTTSDDWFALAEVKLDIKQRSFQTLRKKLVEEGLVERTKDGLFLRPSKSANNP